MGNQTIEITLVEQIIGVIICIGLFVAAIYYEDIIHWMAHPFKAKSHKSEKAKEAHPALEERESVYTHSK